MFKYFKKRKAVKAAQAAYSQESREYFKLTQELEDAQKELKTLESEWMNGLDYGRPKRFDRVQKQEREIRNLKRLSVKQIPQWTKRMLPCRLLERHKTCTHKKNGQQNSVTTTIARNGTFASQCWTQKYRTALSNSVQGL